MSTSLYISNEYISALTGKVRRNKLVISNAEKCTIEPGCMVNGVIIDENKIMPAIKQLISSDTVDTKKIDLVIDGSNIMIKKLDVPIMAQKQILKTVKHEFADKTAVYQELLYDYMVLRTSGKTGGTILCSAAEQKLVGSYIDLFENCGVKIDGVRISVASKIALYRFLPELSEKTMILSAIDGNTMVSTLFVGGFYIMNSRQRLYEERGTDAAMAEITQSLSSLIQFHQTQNTGKTIEKISFCGINQNEKEKLEPLKNALNCPIEELVKSESIIDNTGGKFSISEFCYATGNLLEQRG